MRRTQFPPAGTDTPMLVTDALQRRFRTRTTTVEAVRGIDMTVHPGEIVGLLGPNGAGKTTMMRMLTTLLVPTGGEARVVGHDLRSDPAGVRSRVGYVAQAGGVDPACTVQEELVHQARLHGLGARRARARSAELLHSLDLEGPAERRTAELSGGQRRRLEIAIGLVHDPPLVFLDEPTTGLDPQSRSNLWDHVRRLRNTLGTTVLLTTHYMDEADALCDRVFIVDNGAMVAQGRPTELKHEVGGDVVRIEVPGDAERARDLLIRHQDRFPGVTLIERTDDTIRVVARDGESIMVELLHLLVDEGVHPSGMNVSRPTLEDVFLDLTGRSLRDAAPLTTTASSA